MTEKVMHTMKQILRILPDVLYSICFIGAFLCMCWYLYGVCDLAYVNF